MTSPGHSHTLCRSTTTCNTEGTAVSEIAAIMRAMDRIAMRSAMRDVGPMSMGRAESALLTSPREDHLRVGTH